jgi:hypothetical protein
LAAYGRRRNNASKKKKEQEQEKTGIIIIVLFIISSSIIIIIGFILEVFLGLLLYGIVAIWVNLGFLLLAKLKIPARII